MMLIKAARLSIGDPARRSLMLGTAGAALAHLAGCGGGGGGGSMGSPGSALSTSPPLTDPVVAAGAEPSLPLIPLDGGVVDAAGVRTFTLSVASGTTPFRNGVNTNTLGYNGALLGPALRLRKGEKTSIRVQNRLDEETTVHWHGLVVAADMDGGPHQVIAPGAQWQASFTVDNPASTCWFHPHTHSSTGLRIPDQYRQAFRSKSVTNSDWLLPPVPVQNRHRFRSAPPSCRALTGSHERNTPAGGLRRVVRL